MLPVSQSRHWCLGWDEPDKLAVAHGPWYLGGSGGVSWEAF